MPVIYLYTGEAIPANIKLSDPTVQRGGVVSFQITVAQTMPTPAQASIVEAQGGAKPKSQNQGGFDYYPPIYTIRTKGKQGVPAPRQGAYAKAFEPIVYVEPVPPKKQAVIYGIQTMPTPGECAIMKSHRSKKIQRDEEEKILMLLMGVA